MSNHAESEILRGQVVGLREERAAEREPPPAPGATVYVGQTYNTGGSYPAAAQRYYKIKISEVGGAEVENGTGTVSPKARIILALNLGTRVPPHTPPTTVVVRRVRNRFVFVY